jgi:hypothetical protein
MMDGGGYLKGKLLVRTITTLAVNVRFKVFRCFRQFIISIVPEFTLQELRRASRLARYLSCVDCLKPHGLNAVPPAKDIIWLYEATHKLSNLVSRNN